MTKQVSRKFSSKKAAIAAIAAVAAVVLAATLLLSACAAVEADPPTVDETYFGGYSTEPAFDGYYSAQVDEVLNSTALNDATKAAYLWALASYNWGQTSQYAMFQNKVGDTVLDGNEGTMAYQQYHKEKRADGDYKGEKYHYTIKHIYDSNFSSTVAGLLEDARVRLVVNSNGYSGDTAGLYRFEVNGDGAEVTAFTGQKLLGEDILATKWRKGDDFGGNGEEIHKTGIVAENTKSLDEVIAAIKSDIQTCNVDDRLIQGNINTLADGVVTGATIEKATDGDYYNVTMTFDLAKLNADARSIEFLNSDNSAKNMQWDSLEVSFEMWSNGLFKSYSIEERWTGEVGAVIIWYEGSASAVNHVYFSYTDEDCSMEKEIAYLTEFIESGGAEE